MKRTLLMAVMLVITLLLSACWPGEINVTTVMDENGAGHRDFIVVVYDDSLSEDPIPNPDDPDGTKGNGPVLNDKHVVGGVEALQTWLEDNAPSFMEVLPMETEGLQRIFTMRITFESFEEFLSLYEQIVNLSPTLSWDDFTDAEKPTLEVVEGDDTTTVTFTESKVLLEAAFDWFIDGVYNDIYDEADLAGFVDKASISEFAEVNLTLGDQTLEITSEYDATIDNGDGTTGAVSFVDEESFELVYTFDNPEEPMNNTLFILITIGLVALVGVVAAVTLKK